MCPPRQSLSPPEIGLYWSDEQICWFLDEDTRGFHLQNNVIADSSPYQYLPSNLPEDIWFLVHSNEVKESAFGFWKPKGEACRIYSNSAIIGWRTTLEYFEGKPPHGQRTDWLMQEYRVTRKEIRDDNKPKEPTRSLCRVFLCNGSSSKNELHSKDCKTVVGSNEINSKPSIIPDTNNTSGQDSTRECKAKREYDAGLLPLVDKIPNSSQQDFSKLKCIVEGDYLEWKDLEDPESHSSCSQNSSCPSKLSDEYFDSLKLERDLEEEYAKYIQEKHSSSRYNYTPSVKSNDVILLPASSESADAGSTCVNKRLTVENVLDHTTTIHISDTRNEGNSNVSNTEIPSTSHTNAISNGEKKTADAGRVKKLKWYFCCTPF